MCVCVSTHPRCMEHATTIQFEALRPEACDNITATRYVLGVCTPSPPLFSLSFLLPEQGWKKMAKDRGNDVRFSPRSFSPVYLDLSDL